MPQGDALGTAPDAVGEGATQQGPVGLFPL